MAASAIRATVFAELSDEEFQSARALLEKLRQPGGNVEGERIVKEFSQWVQEAHGPDMQAKILADLGALRDASLQANAEISDLRGAAIVVQTTLTAQIRDLNEKVRRASGELAAASRYKADMDRGFQEEIANLQSLIAARHMEIESLKVAQSTSGRQFEEQLTNLQVCFREAGADLQDARDCVQQMHNEADARLNETQSVLCKIAAVQNTSSDGTLQCEQMCSGEISMITQQLTALSEELSSHREVVQELACQVALPVGSDSERQMDLQMQDLAQDIGAVADMVNNLLALGATPLPRLDVSVVAEEPAPPSMQSKGIGQATGAAAPGSPASVKSSQSRGPRRSRGTSPPSAARVSAARMQQ